MSSGAIRGETAIMFLTSDHTEFNDKVTATVSLEARASEPTYRCPVNFCVFFGEWIEHLTESRRVAMTCDKLLQRLLSAELTTG